MKLVRLGGFVLGLLTFIACVVLLINFTAPNPTGRRYSSRPVLMVGSNNDIGTDAELVLSVDLDLPRNGQAGQRQCFCIRIKPVDTPPTPLAGTRHGKTPHPPNPIGDTLDALNRAEDAAKDTRNHLD